MLRSVRGRDVEHSWHSHHNLDILLRNCDDQCRSTAELLDCVEDLNVQKRHFRRHHLGVLINMVQRGIEKPEIR